MICKKLTIIPALVFILLFTAVSARALEIIYPADHTSFSQSNFLIIKGGANPALDGITIEIGGVGSGMIDISSAEYRTAFKDMLILAPEFDPGKNRIVVEGYVAGKKVSTASAEVFYRADATAAAPGDFAPFVMHLPQKEALCVPCHTMQPDRVELTVAGDANPCASCHRRMLDKSHVHGPAGVYRCAYCHQPESKPNRYQVRAGDAEVCNECHLAKVEAFVANKFVHGPVAAGLCLVCHDPHASDNPAQLVAPINELCLGCHDVIGKDYHVVRGVSGKGHPLDEVGDPTVPGKELSCASCHDPHGGQSQNYFQWGVTSRFVLCQKCHQK
jgi:predicted CXXCH cytochrome family protein